MKEESTLSKKWKMLSLGLNLFVTFLILGIFAYFGYQYYLLTQYKPTTTKNSLKILESKEIDKIKNNTKQFGVPIDISESTGRNDPMVPVK